MKLALVLLLVSSLAYADKPSAKPAEPETKDCTDKATVTITQSKKTFGFHGECKKITITGSKNVVSIESVDKLVVGGTDNLVDVDAVDNIATGGARNSVTYAKAKTGDKPKVTKGGSGNKVVVKK
jgi:DUF3060 family protein